MQNERNTIKADKNPASSTSADTKPAIVAATRSNAVTFSTLFNTLGLSPAHNAHAQHRAPLSLAANTAEADFSLTEKADRTHFAENFIVDRAALLRR